MKSGAFFSVSAVFFLSLRSQSKTANLCFWTVPDTAPCVRILIVRSAPRKTFQIESIRDYNPFPPVTTGLISPTKLSVRIWSLLEEDAIELWISLIRYKNSDSNNISKTAMVFDLSRSTNKFFSVSIDLISFSKVELEKSSLGEKPFWKSFRFDHWIKILIVRNFQKKMLLFFILLDNRTHVSP